MHYQLSSVSVLRENILSPVLAIPPVCDMSALVRSVTSVVTASRPQQWERLDKWNGWANAKSASAQDSLTAVHRFVAYNAGWLQQALGKCLCT